MTEVVISVGRIEQAELVRWVEFGWISPSRSPKEEAELLFSDIDEARIRIICDLRRDTMVEEETMPLVLSLLNQMYALRHQLNSLTSAIHQQPDDVRDTILKQLKVMASRNQDGG